VHLCGIYPILLDGGFASSLVFGSLSRGRCGGDYSEWDLGPGVLCVQPRIGAGIVLNTALSLMG
jgi:hypothetical protein